MYKLLLRLMFLLSPERVHHLAFRVMCVVTAWRPLRSLVARVLGTSDPVLRTRAFGIDFPAPLGLAAGFDKSATGVNAWGAMGFGYAEIGTVTAQAQAGNPKPRVFRLSADRALLNRMGFNNYGAEHVASELRCRHTSLPIGANIGKTGVVPPEGAATDYATSARLLGEVADFLVVNVSSPNTPGLRDLQAVESLRPILTAVLGCVDVPVLVKISPDLSDDDVDAVADLAVELGLAGIVATNSTTSRTGLVTPADQAAALGAGGISGAPIADRSLEVLRRLRARVGDQLTLVSVGGIETVDQAWERILAGASLIQAFTGFIYGGPFWMKRIHHGLARKVREGGYISITEAVGAGTPPVEICTWRGTSQ
ncbi:quinone-dependent dihydroorotate dehydrogenase [Rhodococcus sp. NPDC003382]